MKSGIELIQAERARQISQEGWTAEHDDQHKQGEMALAAVSYALWCHNPFLQGIAHDVWPWDEHWFKPKESDPVLNLVKAGALIAAEIDRLQRASERK